MKTRLCFVTLLFIIFLQSLFSSEQLVLDYNKRAFESIKTDPSNSLYYADKSIDENIDNKYITQYVRSLYIKSMSYSVLDENILMFNTIEKAYSFLENNKIIYDDNDFYIFYGRALFKDKKYDKLQELLSVKKIISNLDNMSLVIFNILKFKLDFIYKYEIDFPKLEQTLLLSQNIGIPELISEVYLCYGDIYAGSNITKAQSNYLKAAETGNNYYSALALFNLGKLINNTNYLKEAYIISELVGDSTLIKDILTTLTDVYKERSDYKNISLTQESLNYVLVKNYSFLLKQNKKIERYSYRNEKLGIELEQSNYYNTIQLLIIISLGVVILFLVILLSIQSYRLRSSHF